MWDNHENSLDIRKIGLIKKEYIIGKAKILLSLDSGYQVHLNFINMNHDKKI